MEWCDIDDDPVVLLCNYMNTTPSSGTGKSTVTSSTIRQLHESAFHYNMTRQNRNICSLNTQTEG